MEIQPKRTKKLLHSLMPLGLGTHTIQVEPIPLFLPRLPQAFHGARVAVIADVHLPDALVSTGKLLRCTALQRPDAIFLPGDMTNSYTDFDARGLRRLFAGLAAIAPCFAIPGNHELRLNREERVAAIAHQCGVHYMCDSYASWQRGEQTIRLFGMGRHRPRPLLISGQPAIALAHKPDFFPYYQRARWDLVVAGHAHGGQVRIGQQGLYAPGQGLFPAYTNGVYTDGGTTMVVSRGLGNSTIPWRVGNAPHLPLLLLLPK